MTRPLVLASIAVIVLLGAAWLLYQQLFPQASPPVVATHSLDAGASEPRSNPPQAPPLDGGKPPADAGTPPVQTAKVISVRGKVKSRRGDEGSWRALATGQALDTADAVRTGRSGEAQLQVGQGVSVRLSPRSEFSIREITEGVSRVRLESGHVSASVDEQGNQVLRVEAKGTDAVAETRGGSFGMVSDGKGRVAVATSTGSVKLTSGGSAVEVTAGTQAAAIPGRPPSAPKHVPRSLFLKLGEPPKQRTNQARTVVEGETVPGSLVRVGRATTTADSAGKFRVPVKLKGGKNNLKVVVVDATGRKVRDSLPEVILDQEKPEVEAEMQWGQ